MLTSRAVSAILPDQRPFSLPANQAVRGHPAHPPRINYTALSESYNTPLSSYLLRFEQDKNLIFDHGDKPPMKGMELVKLHVSGASDKRVNLMFMADGCKFTPIAGSDRRYRRGERQVYRGCQEVDWCGSLRLGGYGARCGPIEHLGCFRTLPSC
jgi:hypothetical protein